MKEKKIVEDILGIMVKCVENNRVGGVTSKLETGYLGWRGDCNATEENSKTFQFAAVFCQQRLVPSATLSPQSNFSSFCFPFIPVFVKFLFIKTLLKTMFWVPRRSHKHHIKLTHTTVRSGFESGRRCPT